MLCVYKMQGTTQVEDNLFSNPGDALNLLWDMLCDDNGSHSDTAVKPDKQETHPDAALDPEGRLKVLLVH